jgi:hypothetical protein
MEEIVLTTDQEVEVERIVDVVAGAARAEIRQMARLLVSKSNRELFGATEFRVREIVHGIGARTLEAALEERKKRGISAPASSAQGVANPPSSSTIARHPSRR